MTATGTPEAFELFAIRDARHGRHKGSDESIGGERLMMKPYPVLSPLLADIMRPDRAPRPL